MRLAAENLAIGYGRIEIGRGIDVFVSSGDILCLLVPTAAARPHSVDPRPPNQAFALDAHILFMKDGGILRRSPVAEALTDATLSAVYGLPISVERTASGRRVCLPSLAPQSTPTMTSDALTTA